MQSFLNQEILITSDTPVWFQPCFLKRSWWDIHFQCLQGCSTTFIFHSYLRVVLRPASRTRHGHRQRIRSGSFIVFSVDGSGCSCCLHEPVVGWLHWLIASSLSLELGLSTWLDVKAALQMTAFLKRTNILRVLNTATGHLSKYFRVFNSDFWAGSSPSIFSLSSLQSYCCGNCIC